MSSSVRRSGVTLLALILTLSSSLWAQEQPDPVTLLPQGALDRIADEVPGSFATRHDYELGAHDGKRDAAEPRTTYFETENVADMARQCGRSAVEGDHIPAIPQ